jgi:hypothetical protein
MVGAVTGEAVVPVLIGVAMKQEGVSAVLVSSFTISVGLVLVYLLIYRLLLQNFPSHVEEHRKRSQEREGEAQAV